MTTTARVYDSDIREDNEETMRNLAAAIALSYTGNWESMIGWQRHCHAARVLTKKDVRTVLNMALSDSMQSHWHDEVRQHLQRIEIAPPPAPKPRLRVVRDEPPKRKWFVRMTATFRSDFFRPNHVMGKLHLVDHGRTFVEWRIPQLYGPHGEYIERHEDDLKTPELVVFGWCGKRYNNPLKPADPEGDELICAGCRRTRDDVGKPPSQTRVCRP